MARRSRWASEAALQALIRYGPEQSGLKALEREAKGTYRTTVRSARGAAQSQVQEIRSARPATRKAYDQAGLRAARAAHDVIRPAISGLGPAAASLVAATRIEQGGLRQRLAESKAGALSDLDARRVQARQGEAYAVSSAGRELKSDLTKVFQRGQDLRRERGAYAALTFSQLQDAARERAQQTAIAEGHNRQQERNSLRSAGLDPDTGRPIRGGPNDPHSPRYRNRRGSSSGGGGATTAQRAAAQDTIQEAQRLARALKGAGVDRHAAASALATGREATQLHDPRTGRPLYNADGTPKMRSGLKAIKSQLLLSAALDEVYDGHLSRQNTRRLHARGLKVRDLPVTPYQEWARRHPQGAQRTPAQQAQGWLEKMRKALGG